MDMATVDIEYRLAGGQRIRIEVSIEVKELLEHSSRQTRSQRRKDRRYLDFVGGVQEFERFASPHEDFADLLNKADSYKRLYAAIDRLPNLQRRRLNLYYFEGLTYRQIAETEGVGLAAVARSVKRALNSLNGLQAQ